MHINRASVSTRVVLLLLFYYLNFSFPVTIFTELHAMQTRSSDENSVCPSVRLSVCLSNASKALQANYFTVVEDRPITCVKYCPPVPVFHFRPELTHPAARSICDSWTTCYFSSSSPVVFGFCEASDGHFCCSLSLTGCRFAACSHCSATGSWQPACGLYRHRLPA